MRRLVLRYLLPLIIGASAGVAVISFNSFSGWFTPEKPAPSSPGDRLARLDSFGGRRADVSNRTRVAALGRLEPDGGTRSIAGIMGERVERLLVKEGEHVEAGAKLAELQSFAERTAELASIDSKLMEARHRLEAETRYATALVREAELAEAEAQLGENAIKVQQAKFNTSEIELETAKKDLERVVNLQSPGAITAKSLDHQSQLVRRAQEQANAEAALLENAKAAHRLNLEKARVKLESAQANLQRVQAAVPIASLEKSRTAAAVALKRTELRAPNAGRILKVFTHEGENIGQKPVLMMGDTSTMFAIAEVYETDVGLIRVGQRATIASQALPESLQGTVERIGMMIHKNDVLHVDPTADADARVVEVRIRLDESALAEQLTNLQVDVLIDMQNTAASKADSTK